VALDAALDSGIAPQTILRRPQKNPVAAGHRVSIGPPDSLSVGARRAPLAAAVHSPVDPAAAAIELAVHDRTAPVQARIYPVALTVEPFRGARPARVIGSIGGAIQSVVGNVAATIQPIFDAIAAPVETLFDSIATPVGSILYACAAIVRQALAGHQQHQHANCVDFLSHRRSPSILKFRIYNGPRRRWLTQRRQCADLCQLLDYLDICQARGLWAPRPFGWAVDCGNLNAAPRVT
jgi:hypothetical protein